MNNELAIKVEGLTKTYRIGEITTGTLSHDLNRAIARVLGKEDPNSKVLGENVRTEKVKSKNEYVAAIQDISFELNKGQVLGIIGKNGAGKSTLLKVLSRVTSPSSGHIGIKGRVASLLEVGTGFHQEMTGRENIFMNGTIMGMKRTEINSKLDEIVEFAGIAKYLDTPVKRYSSGMTVRLGFSIAAFLEPEILIVDEVLAVGDAEFQKKAVGKMKDVSTDSGRTVLFVSHNMGAVKNLCDVSLILQNGRKLAFGKTEEMIDLYLSEFASSSVKKNLDQYGFRVKKIYLSRIDSDDEIDVLISGENYKVVIDYENETGFEISDLHIGIPIFNSNKNFMTVLNNNMSGYYFRNVPNSGRVECELNKFPLMFGMFTGNLNIVLNKNLQISYEDVFEFSVDTGDFYNSGNPNAGNRQGIYIEQKWVL